MMMATGDGIGRDYGFPCRYSIFCEAHLAEAAVTEACAAPLLSARPGPALFLSMLSISRTDCNAITPIPQAVAIFLRAGIF